MENKIEKCCRSVIMGLPKANDELHWLNVVVSCYEEYNKNMYDILMNNKIGIGTISIDFSDKEMQQVSFDSYYKETTHQQQNVFFIDFLLKHEDAEIVRPFVDKQLAFDDKRTTVDFIPRNDNKENLVYDIRICLMDADEYQKRHDIWWSKAKKEINAKWGTNL